MNAERWGETLLGAAVVAVAVGFFAFAAAQAGQSGARGGYELVARFDRANVDVGADVRISGVKIGVVRAVSLEDDRAKLVLAIDRGVAVRNDSVATITTDGLLGGAYVAIDPAGAEPLPEGGEIIYTQGSIDLLTLFASMARGGQPSPESKAP
jgi:phospholipid/cholesterol/gamma-HCH transport system substrate-binding protein